MTMDPLQAGDAAELEAQPVATPARSEIAPPVVPGDDLGMASGHGEKLVAKREILERASSKARS